jgi:hypothetical protein
MLAPELLFSALKIRTASVAVAAEYQLSRLPIRLRLTSGNNLI